MHNEISKSSGHSASDFTSDSASDSSSNLSSHSPFSSASALVLGIVFVAFNLRPSITSVGPVITPIQQTLHLSHASAGLITTLPLLAFGFLSSLAPRLGSRLGNPAAILLGLVVILIGILTRSAGHTAALYIGTLCVGIGIAVSNVLLPGLVKEKFPHRIGFMTGLYTTSMGLMASIASGLSVPLSRGLHLGWQMALSFWAIPVLIAIAIWFPQLRSHSRHPRQSKTHSKKSLWHSKVAWAVTLYMGLQSFLFYCLVTWLPQILTDHGFNSSLAGWMLFAVQFVGLPASFMVPIIAGRFTSQRGLILTIGILYLGGILLLLTDSRQMIFVLLSVILLGIAQGASISLALALLGFRTVTHQQAAQLSGMTQSVGYLLASVGPVLIGSLYDHSHSWTLPISVLIGVNVVMILVGLEAGRNRHVEAPSAVVQEVL